MQIRGGGSNIVCKLHKSLYGLKQAPRQWNLKLFEALVQMGFIQSHYDYSVFTKNVGLELVIVLVYVDNLLVTGSCTTLIDKTRNDLKLNFKVKDLGELKFFLGIEFTRSKEEYVMNQLKYALELISEMGLSGAKPVYTPPDANVRLTTIEYCTHTQGSEAVITDKPFDNIERYQRLVGRLLYLTMTRVDISFTVQVLSQFMHAPKESHMEATLRVVKYIKESPGLGLFMPGKISELLTTYCDSDWGTFLQIRRSVTGYLLKFGDAIISWISKKQDTMA